MYLFAFSVILFSFLVGCSGNWLPNSILFLTRVYHEPFLTLEQCTHLTTFNEMGKILSILFGGYVAKTFGRKKMLIYILLVNFISWMLLCSSTSPMFIYSARLVNGQIERLCFPRISCKNQFNLNFWSEPSPFVAIYQQYGELLIEIYF